MPVAYFTKLTWNQKFFATDGQNFPFVTVGSGDDRIGILALDDAVPEDARKIGEIRGAIGKRGSVAEVTAAEFEELKKKRSEPVSPRASPPASHFGPNAKLQIMPKPEFRRNRGAAAADPAAQPSKPPELPPIAQATPAAAQPPLAPIAPRKPRVARLSTLGKPAPATAPATP